MSAEPPKNQHQTEHHSLTRRMIEDGELDAILARDAPGLELLTQVERESSIVLATGLRIPGNCTLQLRQ